MPNRSEPDLSGRTIGAGRARGPDIPSRQSRPRCAWASARDLRRIDATGPYGRNIPADTKRSIHNNACATTRPKARRGSRLSYLYHRLSREHRRDDRRALDRGGRRPADGSNFLTATAGRGHPAQMPGWREDQPHLSRGPVDRYIRLRELRQVAQKFLLEGDTDLSEDLRLRR